MNDIISDQRRESFQHLFDEIKTERDELRVRAHLLKNEMLDEWEELEEKWEHLHAKAKYSCHEAKEASKEVWAATKLLGQEMKDGYKRVRKSL